MSDTPEVKEFAIIEAEAAAERKSMNPAELLSIAVSQNADIDKLTKLMDLQERWERGEAKRAYVAAMKKFKANPPVITKNKKVEFGETMYKHATLDHVCDVVTKALSEVGISHTWKVTQDKDLISVSCVLTHEMGHSEETQLQGIADKSGSKNSIQAIGSTVTYLQRYTILSACGLAAANDTDGMAEGKPLMETEALEEFMRQMQEVETQDELKTVFAKAYKAASGLSDRKAQNILMDAKNAAKKRLEGK